MLMISRAKQSKLYGMDHLRAAQILIIDEGPMLHKYKFEALDRSLKQMLGIKLPWYCWGYVPSCIFS